MATEPSIQVQASETAVTINIGETSRTIEVVFSDGTKIEHENGSGVIVVTRGQQFGVRGRYKSCFSSGSNSGRHS